jgi:hypothetical protein
MAAKSLKGTIADAEARPDDICTVTADGIIAGALVRRNLRYVLEVARVQGLDVTWAENKGWVQSEFSVRAQGTGRQVGRLLRVIQGMDS